MSTRLISTPDPTRTQLSRLVMAVGLLTDHQENKVSFGRRQGGMDSRYTNCPLKRYPETMATTTTTTTRNRLSIHTLLYQV
jgi:hypothetical protein